MIHFILNSKDFVIVSISSNEQFLYAIRINLGRYKNLFFLSTENDVVSHHQSGHKPSVSGIKLLLSDTCTIYKSLGDCWEIKGILIQISKVFGKVSHQNVIPKHKKRDVAKDH